MPHIKVQTPSERFQSEIAKLQEEKDAAIAEAQEEKNSAIAKAQEEKDAAIAKVEAEHTNHTALLKKKCDDELEGLKSTVDARDWQIKQLIESEGTMTRELDCMKLELQDTNDELTNTMARLEDATVQLGKMPGPQGQQKRWNTVFETYLERDSTRACKNKGVGDPGRSILGAGRLIVKESLDGLLGACQIFNDNNELKFESLIPHKSDASQYFCIKNNELNAIIWDAYNTSPMSGFSGSAQYRPFFLRFNNGPQMFTALLWILGGGTDYAIVQEFLKGPDGIFNRALYEDEDAMDAEGESYVKDRRRPMTEEQEEDWYGVVPDESQAY